MKYMVLCNLPYRLRKIAGRVAKKCRRRRDRSLDAKLEDIRNLLIYNHPISSVPPATGKLRLLQDGNTVLLALFARKCRENGLRYWLDYGTLLGAVRHRGFIPWDDDLDVSMMRPEFDRLLELLPVLFPREEGFTWNRHAFLQIGYEGTPLNLDVYPYHFYSESLSSPERHEKLDRLMSGFKKDVVLVGARMNLTDEQVQEKIRRDIQCIFQDPYSSLDPRMTVGRCIEEPLDVHKVGIKSERWSKVLELMQEVGLREDQGFLTNFPVVNGNVSVLPALLPCSRIWSSAMNLYRLWTYRFRHKS